MVVGDDMDAPSQENTGRDTWACRLMGRSQNPHAPHYSQNAVGCQCGLRGTANSKNVTASASFQMHSREPRAVWMQKSRLHSQLRGAVAGGGGAMPIAFLGFNVPA
jgi:hypothetical protein